MRIDGTDFELETLELELRRITLAKLLAKIKNRQPDAQGGESNVYFVQVNDKHVALVTPRKAAVNPLQPAESQPTPAIHRHAETNEAVLPLGQTPQKTRGAYPRFSGDLDSLPAELSLNQVKEIIGQMAPTLARWHKLGVVHRDLKLGNLLCEKQNEFYLIKFADLGNSIQVNPKDGRLILDGESDIQLAYTFEALPPEFRAVLDEKSDDFEVQTQAQENKKTSAIASNNSRTCIAIIENSRVQHGEGASAGFMSAVSQDERRNALHVKLRDANYLQLDTHAFYEMLLQLRAKVDGKAAELDDLITKLKTGAYPTEANEAFSMQDVAEHSFFGENPADRATFFGALKEQAAAVDLEMPRDILPPEVLGLIAQIKDCQFKEAHQAIEALKPSQQDYRKTLRTMLSKARRIPSQEGLAPANLFPDKNKLYTTIETAVDAAIDALRNSEATAAKTSCCAGLFATNPDVATKKATIITKVLNELKQKNYKHLNSFFIEPVTIQDGEKTIRLSLCEALCLKRHRFSRNRWVENGDYSYQGSTASFDRVVANLKASRLKIDKSNIVTLAKSEKNAPESIKNLGSRKN